MNKKYLSIIAVATLLAAGCSKRPKGILSEEKMVAVMTDIQIAEAYERSGEANSYLEGQDREILGRSILMHHGVTQEVMDSTLAWYGRNMDEYPKLYKKIDAELNRRQLKYARAAGESDNEGSAADLWPYGHHFIIDDKSLTNGIVASIPVTDLAPGSKLIWKMAVQGASGRSMILGVDYDDGTSEVYKNINRSSDKWIETTLQTDSLLTVNRIFAIADFENPSRRIFIDSIQLNHLPFNREDYNKSGFQRVLKPAGHKVILPPDTSLNSSLVPDSIIPNPSSSMENSFGVSTRR